MKRLWHRDYQDLTWVSSVSAVLSSLAQKAYQAENKTKSRCVYSVALTPDNGTTGSTGSQKHAYSPIYLKNMTYTHCINLAKFTYIPQYIYRLSGFCLTIGVLANRNANGSSVCCAPYGDCNDDAFAQ
jgi:hypothetical protein